MQIRISSIDNGRFAYSVMLLYCVMMVFAYVLRFLWLLLPAGFILELLGSIFCVLTVAAIVMEKETASVADVLVKKIESLTPTSDDSGKSSFFLPLHF